MRRLRTRFSPKHRQDTHVPLEAPHVFAPDLRLSAHASWLTTESIEATYKGLVHDLCTHLAKQQEAAERVASVSWKFELPQSLDITWIDWSLQRRPQSNSDRLTAVDALPFFLCEGALFLDNGYDGSRASVVPGTFDKAEFRCQRHEGVYTWRFVELKRHVSFAPTPDSLARQTSWTSSKMASRWVLSFQHNNEATKKDILQVVFVHRGRSQRKAHRLTAPAESHRHGEPSKNLVVDALLKECDVDHISQVLDQGDWTAKLKNEGKELLVTGAYALQSTALTPFVTTLAYCLPRFSCYTCHQEGKDCREAHGELGM